MPNLADSLRNTQQIFRDHALENAELDARLLIEWVTSTNRKDLLLNPNLPIAETEQLQLQTAVQKRLDGMPVYRIIGTREFYGIPFELSAETLEPRPDTEILVDMILPVLENTVNRKKEAQFLDMGTGTGAIAVAALVNVPESEAIAVDISSKALETATKNAETAGVAQRFHPCLSDWFDKIDGTFDVIVSNPPYIPSEVIATLSREVREHDPLRALEGGDDGLYFYRKLAVGSARFLNRSGAVAVEIGQGQERDVIALFADAGFHCVEMRKDLHSITRALLFEL